MKSNMLGKRTLNTKGVVDFWNYRKGFGFIISENGKRYFVHQVGLVIPPEAMCAGMSVWFYPSKGDRGWIAVNVSFRPDYVPIILTTLPDNKSYSPEFDIAVSECTQELIQHLKTYPKDIYQIHPQTFEKLVAAIFRNEGFETKLNGLWNKADGGVDIIAVKKTVDGINLRAAIQCKRYKQDKHITADPIRSLNGILDRFKAHVGIVVTTSYFTKPAQEETESHFWKIGLRDFNSILKSLGELSADALINDRYLDT